MMLSIITICFNNLQELQRTLASVDCQTFLPEEHIIIDGSTNSEIKKYLESHPQPAFRRWICERDTGISDAFNKGISTATGAVTLLLNSGDTLYDTSVLQKVNAAFEKDAALMWCHGMLHTMRGGTWVTVGKPFEKAKLYRGMRGTFHPTMYVKRALYAKYGMFDTNIRMAMDYDFLCRIADEKHTFIPQPLATFDPSGVTSTKYLDAMEETYAVYRKYFGRSFKQTLWKFRLTMLHYLLHSRFGKLLYRLKKGLGLANA